MAVKTERESLAVLQTHTEDPDLSLLSIIVAARFLTVAPSTDADEQLVLDIVKLMVTVVTRCEAGTKDCSAVDEILSWISDMLLNTSGALYHLLAKTDLSADGIDGKSSSAQASRLDAFTYFLRTVEKWLCGIAVGCWTCNQSVTGSNLSHPAVECNPGQVVNTHVPLSPSSIIWYQSMGGDALWLGR